MASEIRVDKINSLSKGVGTVTLSPTGVDISGIVQLHQHSVGQVRSHNNSDCHIICKGGFCELH